MKNLVMCLLLLTITAVGCLNEEVEIQPDQMIELRNEPCYEVAIMNAIDYVYFDGEYCVEPSMLDAENIICVLENYNETLLEECPNFRSTEQFNIGTHNVVAAAKNKECLEGFIQLIITHMENYEYEVNGETLEYLENY